MEFNKVRGSVSDNGGLLTKSWNNEISLLRCSEGYISALQSNEISPVSKAGRVKSVQSQSCLRILFRWFFHHSPDYQNKKQNIQTISFIPKFSFVIHESYCLVLETKLMYQSKSSYPIDLLQIELKWQLTVHLHRRWMSTCHRQTGPNVLCLHKRSSLNRSSKGTD